MQIQMNYAIAAALLDFRQAEVYLVQVTQACKEFFKEYDTTNPEYFAVNQALEAARAAHNAAASRLGQAVARTINYVENDEITKYIEF